MKKKLLCSGIVGVSLFFFFLPPLWAQPEKAGSSEKKEYLTAGELVKTKASQLFVTRHFTEALEEFRALAKQYPKDLIIKRYIGACLDHLKRDEEAIRTFEEILGMKSDDFPSRQYLAKIYLRKGDLNRAEEQLAFIVNNDKQGTFAAPAKTQLDTVKRLKEAGERVTKTPGRAVSPNEFLKSRAAQLFMSAKYQDALNELEETEKRYPEDVLIKRYKGLSLDKLGRFDDAIVVYQSSLAAAPGNIPLHYALAQTLFHKRDWAGAEREFQYVIQNDETGVYKKRAQQELAAVQRIEELLKRGKPKKWSLNASSGLEWNSNATSVTTVRAFRSGEPHNAWKFTNSIGGSYEVFKKQALSIKATYSYYQALYSNSIDQLNTFLNSWGVNGTYIKQIFGKPLIVQVGHTISHTLIQTKYYSTSFANSLTTIYSPMDWYRVTVSEKWSYSTYDNDGSAPDSTSRDGFSNLVSLNNNFYFNKPKTLYHSWAFEFGKDIPQGINYNKNLFSVKTGLHFPIFYKAEGDLSFKFKDSYYPKYGFPSTVPGRRDEEYTFTTALSRPIGKYWTLNGNYTYIHNKSLDDNYTYTNHTLGFSLSYYY